MTLLIAGLLIYMMDLAWWWYAVASLIWVGHVALHTLSDR